MGWLLDALEEIRGVLGGLRSAQHGHGRQHGSTPEQLPRAEPVAEDPAVGVRVVAV
jgi:hypothetical protein